MKNILCQNKRSIINDATTFYPRLLTIGISSDMMCLSHLWCVWNCDFNGKKCDFKPNHIK
jgi:hypothetical protein